MGHPKTFLGFRLHIGEPELPTKLRSYKNSLLQKDNGGQREGINNYIDHDLARWYGVSFKLNWFAGFWLFGETSYQSERGPLPSSKRPRPSHNGGRGE